ASLMEMNTFKPLELLFLAMNNELTHARVTDPVARLFMLQFEIQLRVQDEGSLNQSRLRTLVRRMRAHVKSSASSIPYASAMLHLTIMSLKLRAQKDSPSLTAVVRYRLF